MNIFGHIWHISAGLPPLCSHFLEPSFSWSYGLVEKDQRLCGAVQSEQEAPLLLVVADTQSDSIQCLNFAKK